MLPAEKQPNSEKLLKMSADLGGGETRQIMVGPGCPSPAPAGARAL